MLWSKDSKALQICKGWCSRMEFTHSCLKEQTSVVVPSIKSTVRLLKIPLHHGENRILGKWNPGLSEQFYILEVKYWWQPNRYDQWNPSNFKFYKQLVCYASFYLSYFTYHILSPWMKYIESYVYECNFFFMWYFTQISSQGNGVIYHKDWNTFENEMGFYQLH